MTTKSVMVMASSVEEFTTLYQDKVDLIASMRPSLMAALERQSRLQRAEEERLAAFERAISKDTPTQ